MNRKRTVQGLVGISLAAAILALVVLPALASSPGTAVPPPSTLGVTPVVFNPGSQSNDCAAFYAGNSAAQPKYQYRIASPKSQTYTTTVGGFTVTFKLTLNPADAVGKPANGTNKYFDFSATGANVVDVGVRPEDDDGGDHEGHTSRGVATARSDNDADDYGTRYSYASLSGGFVASDGALHGTAESTVSSSNPTPKRLSTVDSVTFCFNLGSVSGTVYSDLNESTTLDAGDTPLSGWTVRLYKGVTAGTAGGGTVIGTATTATDGKYRINVGWDGTATYRVCELPPSGTWAQSQPLPTATTLCAATGELKKGYDVPAPTGSASPDVNPVDFGNVTATPAPCPAAPFGTTDGTYQIQLAGCKANAFAFKAGTQNGAPLARVWAGDETQSLVPLTEKITWPYSAAAGQNKLTVIYNDTFPFTGPAKTMQYCLVDPRAGGTGLTLTPPYDTAAGASSVLPAGETSCLITTTESAAGTFVVYVYSLVDGWRSTA